MKKLLAMLLTLSLCVSVPAFVWAAEFQTDDAEPDRPATAVIEISEGELIAQMIAAGELTYEDLNAELLELSSLYANELAEMGYDTEQIGTIKSYTEGTDAFSYLYGSEADSPALTFRYGIAGSDNSKRNARIAYDARWSKRPTLRYSDTIGLHWRVYNGESQELATKVDSVFGVIVYEDGSTAQAEEMELYPGVGVLIFEFPAKKGGLFSKNYVESVSGVIEISTQADSCNMEFLHLSVAYAQGNKQGGADFRGITLKGGGLALSDPSKAKWLVSPVTMAYQAVDYNGNYVFRRLGTE